MKWNSNVHAFWVKIMTITISQLTVVLMLTEFAFANDGKAQEALNQHVTLHARNTELQNVLQKLEKIGKVQFVYSPRIIPVNYRVSLHAQAEKLATVLDNLLRPLEVTYEMVGGQIVLKKKAGGESSLLPESATGQEAADPGALTVKGRVVSEQNEGLPGVSVVLKGTTTGTSTDVNGQYSLTLPDGDGTLVFSFIGFVTEEVAVGNRTTLDVKLLSDVKALAEVVVVGYGSQRKTDLTGSVATISSESFNKGQIMSPDQLLTGKVAGVQITPNGGAPGSGSRIRIRAGSSLNASNDPLIVIDGVPVDNSETKGSTNALSLINPNDIESFNILKDASATAIYGSRASNGVIIITTKKGTAGDKLAVNFSSVFSVSTLRKTLEVLSADQFRTLVNANGTAAQKAQLGNDDTNWQDLVFKDALGTDNNLSVSGSYKTLPYRVSVGYMNQDGILKTSNFERVSAAVNLNPSFLNNHLKVNLNLKGSVTDSRFADQAAIGSAVSFDPTQPVYAANSKFGGYYEWTEANGNPNTFANRNPLSLLEQRDNRGQVKRSIGNLQFDYKFHFLPELRANLNLGYDVTESDGLDYLPATLASVYVQGGSRTPYSQTKSNQLLDFYLNYVKDLPGINSRIDVTAGYSYQSFLRDEPTYAVSTAEGDEIIPAAPYPFKTQNRLIGFFGRVNYAYKNRYLLTSNIRRDGSSRFGPGNQWGTFPSIALGWRIKEESFLKGSRLFSELKLRAGIGFTGQQDIGSDYAYLPKYTYSDNGAQYQFGDQYYLTLRPQGYDANIKWETTQTNNVGLDFGFLKGRISGSVDYYYKKTKDLLAIIPVPAGSNLTNRLYTNVGNIENKGLEAAVNIAAVTTEKFKWDLGFNATFNTSKITNLSKTRDVSSDGNTVSEGIPVGGIAGGVGNNIQIHTVGYRPNAFYVYQQVYNTQGSPVEGLYVDRNQDGVVNEKDRYRYQNPESKAFFGFNTQLSYNSLSFGLVLRGSVGNYAYNNIQSGNGVFRNNTYLSNLTTAGAATNFANYQYFSDYYVENASFLRMETMNLGYDFGKILRDKATFRLSLNVQNAFVITKYTGLDPEIVSLGTNQSSGIDNNYYPRPRIVSLGLNLGF